MTPADPASSQNRRPLYRRADVHLAQRWAQRHEETAESVAQLDALLDGWGIDRHLLPAQLGPASSARLEAVLAATHVLKRLPAPRRALQLQTFAFGVPSLAAARDALDLGYPLVDEVVDCAEARQASGTGGFEMETAISRIRTVGICWALRQSAARAPADYHRAFDRLIGLLAERNGSLDHFLAGQVAKAALFGSIRPEDGTDLEALALWADRVRTEVGSIACSVLFDWRPIEQGRLLAEVSRAAELTCELADGPAVPAAIRRLAGSPRDIRAYIAALEGEVGRRIRPALSPQALRNIAESFHLGADFADQATQAVVEIEREMRQLAGVPMAELAVRAARAGEVVGGAAGRCGLVAGSARLLALAGEAVRRHLGITPFPTQFLVVIGLLAAKSDRRGRVGQVNTGEGKSIITTLLALYLARCGRRVDIISSSRALACRDREKFAAVYGSWGLRAADICRPQPDDAAFAANVVYGTNFDFEFALLFEDLGLVGDADDAGGDRCRPPRRHHDIAVVDEVDNLFIDQAQNNAIVSVPSSMDDPWMVMPLIAYCRANPARREEQDEAGAAREYLASLGGGALEAKARATPVATWARWLAGARRALDELKEGEDYVVLSDARFRALATAEGCPVSGPAGARVVLVDRNTGHLQLQSRWQDRLHQYVEAKHDLLIRPETLTAAQVSHPVFFDRYDRLFGITGTIGSAREVEEVLTTYRVDTFVAPPNRPNIREHRPTAVCARRDDFLDKIGKEVDAAKKSGRPCLVLAKTIGESESLSAHLDTLGIEHQILNDIQQEKEEVIVARAGRERVVTVATNTAGRGTDIVLSHDSLEAGGLHVLVTFLADNVRMETQALGRAGRQGQAGSGQVIVFLEPLRALARSDDDLTTASGLERMRTRIVGESSRARIAAAEAARQVDRAARDFCGRLRAWDDSVDAAEVDRLAQRMAAQLADSRPLQPRDDAPSDSPSSLARATLVAQYRTLASATTPQQRAFGCRAWATSARALARQELLGVWARALRAIQQAASVSAAPSEARGATFAQAAADAYAPFAPDLDAWLTSPADAYRRLVRDLTGGSVQ